MKYNANTIEAIIDKFVMPEPNSGCWLFLGALNGNKSGGYGLVKFKNRNWQIHRLLYEFFVGPIPDGLTIDHKCRIRVCCNPRHLEPVTNHANILRGISPAAINARKTHCPNGHELSGENLYKPFLKIGARLCAICYMAYCKEYRKRGIKPTQDQGKTSKQGYKIG